MNKSKYLQTALKAVKAAEKVIKKYYSPEVKTNIKQDLTPVTIADQKAEELIKKIVLQEFPDHSFLGEENSLVETESEYKWVVDPIDGTKQYMRQIPIFATQLALFKGDEVIVGVSNAPALDELMYAQKGEGAFLNDESLRVSQIDKLKDAYMVYGSITHFDKQGLLENLINLENKSLAHRGYADFWGYHLLAQGKVDVMVEAKIKIWDVAALSLIVSEAGGKMTNFAGEDLNQDIKTAIATNDLLHQQVVDLINQ